MCGRFAIAYPKFGRIEKALGTSLPSVSPNYNIAPTQNIPAIVQNANGCYDMVSMRWGLVPNWSKEATPKFSTFNARVDSVEEKPAFKESFRAKRCIIPASGFYEWKEVGGKKRPFYITDAEGEGFAFAGLWDVWKGSDDKLVSCTILVGEPNQLVSTIHNRMPAILREEDLKPWLDMNSSTSKLRNLLSPFPADQMRVWPVSQMVGNTRNNSPDLIKPIE